MNRLNKTEFAIFVSMILSLLAKDLTNQNLLKLLIIIIIQRKKNYSEARV